MSPLLLIGVLENAIGQENEIDGINHRKEKINWRKGEKLVFYYATLYLENLWDITEKLLELIRKFIKGNWT